MAEKNKYSKMLRVVADLFEELNEKQIDDILSGKGRLVYELQSNTLTEKEPKIINDFEDGIERIYGIKIDSIWEGKKVEINFEYNGNCYQFKNGRIKKEKIR